MKKAILMMFLATSCGEAQAGSIEVHEDSETNWAVYTLRQGDTVVKVVPAAGCNAYFWEHRGTQLFRTPEKLADLPGYGYGNPVIYPMPNRVRDAQFEFEGQIYKFPANNGPNFLHGLVHSVPWEVVSTQSDGDHVSLTAKFSFEPGTQAHELFPFPHTVLLEITVSDGKVRWTYTVDNSEGDKKVPFGMCFHPYFLYLGSRAETYLKVPATHLMESVDLLPTGKLLELEGTKFDARSGVSLEGFVVDDVYFGMRPDQPATIEFRDKEGQITLQATEDFTHMVVYTPAEREFFCVENQTCSTDAHNLYARGLNDVAHLMIAEPGQKHSGWVEYQARVR